MEALDLEGVKLGSQTISKTPEEDEGWTVEEEKPRKKANISFAELFNKDK